MRIENLSKEIDMTAVRGGDNGNAASNIVAQKSLIYVPVTSLSEGPSNTTVNVSGSQNAGIWNTQGAGDSFFAAFPTFGF